MSKGKQNELLLINENKSNNFDFKSNNLDVKSNEELFKQALVEGLNRHFDKTIEEAKKIEQIEEMAKDLCDENNNGICSITNTPCDLKCRHRFPILTLCKKGWRKQSEGEWVGEADGYADGELVYDVWHCSECNHCIDDGTDDPDLLPNFCPNCGAKMKGE